MAVPNSQPIHRVVDLVEETHQHLLGITVSAARERLLAAPARGALELAGSFALVAREGQRVCLARSLDRPLRYFLAKEEAGPLLVVAERIDEIRDYLEAQGYGHQFHPSYTRMVPAHHVTELQLVGCPDPNPKYHRVFTPPRGVLPADLDHCGRVYVEALAAELAAWVAEVPAGEPLGVLFSGGGDSATVLVVLEHVVRQLGQSPARLKAFTLAVEGGGPDLAQAREALAALDLAFLGEAVEVPASAIDPWSAIAVIEDYKPRDVECAAMTLALSAALRERYPSWRYLVDGDGGDENLKDYPIEENPELTIRSVVNNAMLYQEGWGVDAIKHSLTYSGGFSRGCVRTYAPLARYGFVGFSPFTRPAVVAAAEAIPFAELAGGSNQRLYALKGELLARGVAALTGRRMPVFPKRRFQEGAAPEAVWRACFAVDPAAYRTHFLSLHGR